MSSRRKNRPADSDDDDDDDEEEGKAARPSKKRKKFSFVDDAAEESGDDIDDDDEDEEEDDENNDYIKDGFVVDEDEDDQPSRPARRNELEDSDDDEDDDDERVSKKNKRKLKKMSKLKITDRLDEDDLILIQESQGVVPRQAEQYDEPVKAKRVVAKSEAELRESLFMGDSDDEQEPARAKPRKPQRVEHYDEDGMEDFIEDDIGDQGAILDSERRDIYDEEAREATEAQLHEASEIFGTDYLDFMQQDGIDEDEEEVFGKYREPGVGVDLGVDSEEESDEDEDTFRDEDDDEMDGKTAQQRDEALRLKREKRKLEKAERRHKAQQSKAEKRKAQLRRAFEPVQLVENFCTERDDEIRQADVPERLFDWKTPFHGSEKAGMNEMEEAEATWIVGHVPDIAMEFALSDSAQQHKILTSITNALRFMHRDKLEPAFIKRYRQDDVNSSVVRENLYEIMDQDSEWDRLISARTKVEGLLNEIAVSIASEETADADMQKLQELKDKLEALQNKVNDNELQEVQLKNELEALGGDDSDDELFGDSNKNTEVCVYAYVGQI
jgi:transcription elongation factor SPT6